MTITTEEAERLAKQHDLVRFTLGMRVPEHDVSATTIRSLAAERDALKAEKVNLQDDLASAERERAHQHDRADRNAAEYAREQGKREALQARIAELEKQNDMLRHATDKLRAMFTELNARHEPLQRAFITAVELLNDATLEGKKDE